MKQYLVYLPNRFAYVGWALTNRGLAPCFKKQTFDEAGAKDLQAELKKRGRTSILVPVSREPEIKMKTEPVCVW